MKNFLMTSTFVTMLAVAATSSARDRNVYCDPTATQIQSACCQGTLLPYHVALKRADDATRAEAALAQTTQERDNLQAELAKAKAEMQAAVAERDTAVAERDKAREEAAISAKAAKDQEALAIAAKQAADVAAKAKTEAELLAAKVKADSELAATKSEQELAKLKDDLTKQVTTAQTEAKNAVEEVKQAKVANEKIAAELKKATDEVAQLKEKMAAVLNKKDEKSEEQPAETKTP